MASIFTRIVNGEIPAYKVAEDAEHLAFLDVFPLVKGHTLVIPKKETDNILDLSEEAYEKLFRFARKVGIGIRKEIPCIKVGMAVVGLEVPHVHIHLVPLQEIGDLNFQRPKLQLLPEEMEAIRLQIATACSR